MKPIREWSNSPCFHWTGSTNSKGYGTQRINGRLLLAHRVAYEANNGEIPKGMWVLHKCDNPICVRPSHLELGDRKKNMLDCVKRGRHPNANKTHCSRGHKFNKENTRIVRARGFIERKCKECHRRIAKKSYYTNLKKKVKR